MKDLNATAASVLGFLLQGPRSGYQLSRDIEASVGGFWNTTQSQIYRELRALEAAKLIKTSRRGARSRREHAITPAGSAAFSQWLASEPSGALVRDAFALRAFFGEHVDRAVMQRLTRRERALHKDRFDALRARDSKTAPGAGKLALDLDMRREQAMLAWLDTLPWK